MNREALIQRALVDTLRALHPDWIVASIPNEGAGRNARLRANGVLAGMPDVVCVLPRARTIWIEVKAPGGRVSPAQAYLHAKFRKLGHSVAVSFGELPEIGPEL